MASLRRILYRSSHYVQGRLLLLLPVCIILGIVFLQMSGPPIAQDNDFSIGKRANSLEQAEYENDLVYSVKDGSNGNPLKIAEVLRKEARHNSLASKSDNPASDHHRLVKERCQNRRLSRRYSKTVPNFPMDPIISRTHNPNLFFCPLAKAGSTYFTRYMIAMNRDGPMVSPFDIPIEEAGRDHVTGFKSLGSTRNKQLFLENSYKFLFTRDPYGRIFSSYVDKLYSPNPYFWGNWGSAAVKQSHLNPGDHKCGSGVSFPHFIKLVISKLHKTDMHFIPQLKVCSVCDLDWSFVGKLERANDDITYLSEQIHVNSSFLHQANYHKASSLDVIHDSILNALGEWKTEIQKCIGMYNAGRIIWRRLQIRGIIYNDIPFPFSEHDMDSISSQHFKSKCIEAAEKSTDKKRLKSQKLEAFHEAYSSVSKNDIVSLKNIFYDDLFVLGYDLEPSSISNKSSSTHSGKTNSILDWRTEWV